MESAANELNIGALVPSLGVIMGLVRFLFLLSVVAGPVLMLVFGRIYRDNPPKEANYSMGYRCWRGMASLEAWTFTQKLAGQVFTKLGKILTVIAGVIGIVLLFLPPVAMAWTAVITMIAEVAVIGGTCIYINAKVAKTYDKEGYLL